MAASDVSFTWTLIRIVPNKLAWHWLICLFHLYFTSVKTMQLYNCNRNNNPIYNVYIVVNQKLATTSAGSIYTDGPFGL